MWTPATTLVPDRAKMLLNARIREFVVEHPYPDELGRKMLAQARVKVRKPV